MVAVVVVVVVVGSTASTMGGVVTAVVVVAVIVVVVVVMAKATMNKKNLCVDGEGELTSFLSFWTKPDKFNFPRCTLSTVVGIDTEREEKQLHSQRFESHSLAVLEGVAHFLTIPRRKIRGFEMNMTQTQTPTQVKRRPDDNQEG